MADYKYKTVLLVEDKQNDSIHRINTLKKNGYLIKHAYTINDFLNAINDKNQIDLILIDIDYFFNYSPSDDFSNFFNKLDIPVVYLLSDPENELIELIEKNSYGYIIKDSGDKLLLSVIKMALRFFELKQLEESEKRQVQEGEDRYRSIFENTGTSMFLIENDMTIRMVNEEFVRQFRYTREQVIGRMKWTDLVAPECVDFMAKQHNLRRKKPNEARTSYEFKFITGDGETRFGIIAIGMISGTEQSIASVTDITELKKAKEHIKKSNLELQALNEELAAINEEFEATNEELLHTNMLLEEKEQYYRTLFENTGSSIIVIEEDTTISLANENFARQVGYKRDELEGKVKWTELVHEEDSDRMVKQHYLRRKNPVNAESSYEFRFKTRYGNLIDTLLFVSMIPGTRKSIASLFDITARKKAEKELQISETKYRTIFENVQDVFYQTDLNGIITEISPSIEKYSGFTREELIGIPVKNVYCESADRDRLVELILEKGSVTDHELLLKSKERRVIIVSTNSHIIYNSAGIPEGIEGSLRDITERKKFEENLRIAEQKYRTLVENLIEIVYRINDKAVITYISPNVEEIIGFTPSEITGRSVVDFIHPDDISEKFELLLKSLSGISEPSEHRIFDKQGNIFWFRTNAKPVFDNGKVIGVQGVLTNITDLKLAEEEKRKIEKDLFRIQKMEVIGTLAGGIAHNFNNILMGIMGYTSLMIEEKEPEHPDYEYLKNIEESVSAASELTKNLLGFARGGKYEVKPTDINELIRREIRIFCQTKKEIIIDAKFHEQLFFVNADQGQIRQVLLNLFINAWQAMPDGGKITVQTENITISEIDDSEFNVKAGKYARISVTDTGIGMNKEILENIFTPFFSTKDSGEGTGLGLASVYGIVTNHGGSIKAYSEPGIGSTFSFMLPASDTKIGHVQKIGKNEKLIKGKGVILLVDDETMILNVGEKLLKYLGYDVIKAKSGKEAVELYAQKNDIISLVILDMIMPDMDGRETYDRLKSINYNIIVLLASGYSIDDNAQKLLKHGFCGFIQKPYNINELSRKIHELVITSMRRC